MNIKIAIVEDNPNDANLLSSFVDEYAKGKSDLVFEKSFFNNGDAFLKNYHPIFDLIFMDIQMPGCDGMSVCQAIRKTDEKVLIVFVTNMSNYAVKGYSVNAIDFVIKPIKYAPFSIMMDKILRNLNNKGQSILVKTSKQERVIPIDNIVYISVDSHKLYIHLLDEDIEAWGSLGSFEEALKGQHFSRCNNYTIVNLKHIKAVIGDEIRIGDEVIYISRGKKKQFKEDLLSHYGSKF